MVLQRLSPKRLCDALIGDIIKRRTNTTTGDGKVVLFTKATDRLGDFFGVVRDDFDAL
jgi:hypothetical protein